jgi:HEAT repeat protein
MAKTRGVDAKLARLQSLRRESVTPAVIAELRKVIGDSSNLVVAAAAEIAGQRNLAELADDLEAAFARFLVDAAETDKVCRAKSAIIVALNQFEHAKEAIYLTGIRHFQKEPAWGKPVDTAAALRGNCAFALARLGHRDVLLLLADLLGDEEKIAREAAAQALGATGQSAAIPLLRFKARAGDAEPTVVGECLKALMTLAPAESLPFVAEFLKAGDAAIQEEAMFALAESRRAAALPLLRDRWPQARRGSLIEALLLAISMLRSSDAVEFLVTILAEGTKGESQAALAALAIHRHSESIRTRVAATVAARKDAVLEAKFQAKFSAAD